MKFIPELHLTRLRYYRIAVGTFFFMQGLVFASWASRIPDIKTALGLSDASLGTLLLAIPVGQLCTLPLSGYLVNRLGSRRVLSIAALFYPAMLVLLGLMDSMWHLWMALFLFGMGANLSNIAINTQGVGVERLYGRSIMATFHGLWSIAGFIGGLISTWMVGLDIEPFPHFCIIFGICALNLLAMVRMTLPRDVTPAVKTEPRNGKFIKPDSYIVLLGLIAFGNMACEGTMFDWSGVYFETVIDPPKELVRLGYIACMCTMATGRFIADRFVTRFGAIPVIRTSGAIISIGLLLSVIFPYLATATVGFMLVGFGISSVVPICYSLAGKSTTMRPGPALAAVSTIGFLGFLMGPPLIGFIAHALSLRWSFALIACIGLLNTVISPMLRSRMTGNVHSAQEKGAKKA